MGLSPVSIKKDRKAVTEHCAGGKPETVSNFTETLTDYRGKDEFGLWQLHFSWPHTCSVSHSESLWPLASACLLVTGVPQGVRTPSLPLSVLSLLFSSRTFSLPWNFRSFPYLIVLHPSRVSSPSSLCPQLCPWSPVSLLSFPGWPCNFFLLPVSFFGNRLRYSRGIFWLEAVSSQASLFPRAPLCSFVHGAECHIRNSDFAQSFPFSLSSPLPFSFFLLYPSYFVCTWTVS